MMVCCCLQCFGVMVCCCLQCFGVMACWSGHEVNEQLEKFELTVLEILKSHAMCI